MFCSCDHLRVADEFPDIVLLPAGTHLQTVQTWKRHDLSHIPDAGFKNSVFCERILKSGSVELWYAPVSDFEKHSGKIFMQQSLSLRFFLCSNFLILPIPSTPVIVPAVTKKSNAEYGRGAWRERTMETMGTPGLRETKRSSRMERGTRKKRARNRALSPPLPLVIRQGLTAMKTLPPQVGIT